MPRRELLTPAQRAQLLAFPSDESELIRRFTFSKEDLTFVRQHRGDQNRLGVAVQMGYLRYPGRVLGQNERPYAPLLGMVAAQLKLSPSVWELYAQRDQTRREHLQELIHRLHLSQFNRPLYRAIAEWLLPIAMQTTQGMALAQTVVDELRKRQIVLPPVAVIERLCAEVSTRAEASLRAVPNRFNGLYGAAQAAQLAGNQEKAKRYYAELLRVCDKADSERPELRRAKMFLAAS